MLLFKSLKDLSQEASTYSKLATETLKQDLKSVIVNIKDCVSLLTTCHMSKASVKSFSGVLWTFPFLVYYEHFSFYCDAFVFKITFFDLFIVNFKQILRLDLPFSVTSLRHVLSRLLGWVKVNKITERSSQ